MTPKVYGKPSYSVRMYQGTILVSASNPVMGTTATVELTPDQHVRFLRWLQGGHLLQDMLPDIEDGHLYALLTGVDAATLDDLFRQETGV